MNFFECQEFFKNLYPEKLITFEFDENCYRFVECVVTRGLPNIMHHVECQNVKVSIDGMPDQYIPIAPHRLACSWKDLKKFISGKEDVWIDDSEIESLRQLKDEPDREKDFEDQMNLYERLTDLPKEALIRKIDKVK